MRKHAIQVIAMAISLISFASFAEAKGGAHAIGQYYVHAISQARVEGIILGIAGLAIVEMVALGIWYWVQHFKKNRIKSNPSVG